MASETMEERAMEEALKQILAAVEAWRDEIVAQNRKLQEEIRSKTATVENVNAEKELRTEEKEEFEKEVVIKSPSALEEDKNPLKEEAEDHRGEMLNEAVWKHPEKLNKADFSGRNVPKRCRSTTSSCISERLQQQRYCIKTVKDNVPRWRKMRCYRCGFFGHLQFSCRKCPRSASRDPSKTNWRWRPESSDDNSGEKSLLRKIKGGCDGAVPARDDLAIQRGLRRHRRNNMSLEPIVNQECSSSGCKSTFGNRDATYHEARVSSGSQFRRKQSRKKKSGSARRIKSFRLLGDILSGRSMDTPSSPGEKSGDFAARSESVKIDRRKIKIRSEWAKISDVKKSCLNEGNRVWLRNIRRRWNPFPKLLKRWDGPYTIKKKISGLVYVIQKSPKSKPKWIHLDRLAPFHGNSQGCLS